MGPWWTELPTVMFELSVSGSKFAIIINPSAQGAKHGTRLEDTSPNAPASPTTRRLGLLRPHSIGFFKKPILKLFKLIFTFLIQVLVSFRKYFSIFVLFDMISLTFLIKSMQTLKI